MTKFFLTSWSERPAPVNDRVVQNRQLPEVEIDIGFYVLRSGPDDNFDEAYRVEGFLKLRSTEAPNIEPYERDKWVRDMLRKAVDSSPEFERLTSTQEQ